MNTRTRADEPIAARPLHGPQGRVRPGSGRQRRARGLTLPQILAAAVEANPTSVGVTCAGRSLTYAELDERSVESSRMVYDRTPAKSERVV
ncbi:hypothetical protein, partial [Antrihabitans spumae]